MNKTIPIMIDDRRMYKDFNMARCTYFSIECDRPSGDWILGLESKEIPFFLLGISGIIFKPLSGNSHFNSVHSIDLLFDTVEDNPSLFIDINDIWLPNYLFREQQKRGFIFRIPTKLFFLGLQYRDDRISLEKYNTMCEEFHNSVKYSEKESEIFKKWNKSHIKQAINMYQEKKKFALEWDDSIGFKGGKNE